MDKILGLLELCTGVLPISLFVQVYTEILLLAVAQQVCLIWGCEVLPFPGFGTQNQSSE